MPAASTAVASAIGYGTAFFTVPLALGLIAIRRLADFSPRLDRTVSGAAALIPAAFGIHVRVRGGRNIPGSGPVIFMANHINIFDGFILRGHLPRSFRGVELDSHFRWPVYGTAMRLYGNIPISHTAPRAAMRSLERAYQALHRGDSLLILPEGHRSRDGRLQRFMRGPFRLAIRAELPVVPVVMVGAYQRKRVSSWRVTPGVVELRVGAAITPTGYDEEALRTALRERMLTLLNSGGGSAPVPVHP